MAIPQETAGSGPDRARSAWLWPPSGWRASGAGWREVVSLATVAAGTLYLVVEDGGRPYDAMLPVLVLGVAATIGAWPTLRRLPRWLLIATTWWAVGPVLALAFAEVRAGWVRPVAAWTVAGVMLVASLHLLQRRWGLRAIMGLAGAALAISWYQGLLVWWAGGASRGEPAWMSLSWHNQSGTLMGVLGVAGLGAAMTRTGGARAVGVIASAAGLSAAWFSASRGAIVAVAVACVVVAVAAFRREVAPARPLLASLVVAAVTVAAVFALLPVWGAASGDASAGLGAQPVSTRAQGAASNLQARFGHWEAAVRMFADAPLTGTGPGSFRWSSVPVYPEDTNLTSSAHGEQLEALGEQGLLGGGMAVVVTLGLAWVVLAVLLRPGPRWEVVPAAGMATLLLSHAALDFDWDYPVLLALTAIAASVLLTARTDASGVERDQPWAAGVASASLLFAGAVAITGIIIQTGDGSLPWQLQGRLEQAIRSAEDDPGAAEAELATVARWNPGAPDLPAARAFVAHATGDVSGEELRAQVDPEATSVPDQLRAAGVLLEHGRPDLSLEVLEEARPVIDRRRAWGMAPAVAEAALLELEAHARRDGCDVAAQEVATLAPWVATHDLQIDELSAPEQLARFDRGDHLDVWPSCAADDR